jgi:hypothetical protein
VKEEDARLLIQHVVVNGDHIDPAVGLMPFQARKLAVALVHPEFQEIY